MQPAARRPLLRLVPLLCMAAATACGDGDAKPIPSPAPDAATAAAAEDIEALVARERCAALMAKDLRPQALAELAPLLARAQPEAEDLIRAALIELARFQHDSARAYLERARVLAPEEPRVHYALGWLHHDLVEYDAGIASFEHLLVLAPDDTPAQLMLAQLLEWRSEEDDLAQPDDLQRAIQLRLRVIERGVEFGGSWFLTALHQQALYLDRENQGAEAAELRRRKDELEATGIKTAQEVPFKQGVLGLVSAPAPRAARRIETPTAPQFESPRALGGPGGQRLRRAAVAESWLSYGLTPETSRHELGPAAWLTYGASPLQVWSGPEWKPRDALAVRVSALASLDLDRNGKLDFLISDGERMRLYVETETPLSAEEIQRAKQDPNGRPARFGSFERWEESALALPELPAPPSQILAVDEDHDGDLDVVLVGPFGARLWRNDGVDRLLLEAAQQKRGAALRDAEERGNPAPPLDPHSPLLAAPLGTFTDATQEAGLSEIGAVRWCVSEDFDGDQDVDLLFGGPDGWRLFDNQRGGVFARKAASEPQGVPADVAPHVADFDDDARVDLWLPGAPARVLLARAGGGFAAAECGSKELAAPTLAGGVLADLDLDGSVDVVAPADGALYAGRLGLGKLPETPFSGPAGPTALSLACGDFNDDGVPDLARSTASGIELLAGRANGNRGVRIALSGKKDNRRALGAVAEVRAGARYRRIHWSGEPELVGIGKQSKIDILRVRWPNGVLQQELDLPAGSKRAYDQTEGLTSSCPFLYTWNGERYVYITDVLGITPLGLPMAPGMLVPPDHDEYVRVRGEDLAPRRLDDGREVLELQFTEELREVTYLDHVRLDVVDHPIEVEIQPNERFAFPPFPEAHTHTLRDPLPPLRATGSDGRDWTAALQRDDESYAIPFHSLRGREEGQYLGLCDPWWLEFEFDAARLARATKLRFVMTGWFYWSDASVNMAAARTGDVAFVPPLLELQGADGAWRPVGPPLGFPAGKRKTMVVDATELLRTSGPEPRVAAKLRISTTLRIYWDSIRIAIDDDDAPLLTTQLAAIEGELWQRGFSRNVLVQDAEMLDWFDWDELEPFPRWNQHPGMYTRLGEVRPLLDAVDDQFVVMGSGDALRVRFDASKLPALRPGWKRDYLVYLDGWAKDRDPNTLEALYVEPLPFHGMSGYPYRADEHFPDSPAHRRWRAEWQTRPAKRWIEPLCPTGEIVFPASAGPR
jgi:tetratricopeptide (TPR) repeat protein